MHYHVKYADVRTIQQHFIVKKWTGHCWGSFDSSVLQWCYWKALIRIRRFFHLDSIRSIMYVLLSVDFRRLTWIRPWHIWIREDASEKFDPINDHDFFVTNFDCEMDFVSLKTHSCDWFVSQRFKWLVVKIESVG